MCPLDLRGLALPCLLQLLAWGRVPCPLSVSISRTLLPCPNHSSSQKRTHCWMQGPRLTTMSSSGDLWPNDTRQDSSSKKVTGSRWMYLLGTLFELPSSHSHGPRLISALHHPGRVPPLLAPFPPPVASPCLPHITSRVPQRSTQPLRMRGKLELGWSFTEGRQYDSIWSS